MVCRFVQQQNVWAAEKSVRQQHLDFVEGSHVFHLLFMQFIADPKTLQQTRGFRVRVPAAEFGEFAFQFRQMHAVGV